MVTCDEAVATLNDEESGAKQRERALAAFPGKYGLVFHVLSFFGRLSGRRRNWVVIRIELAD